MTKRESELKAEFKNLSITLDDALFNLSPAAFVRKWEAHAINKKLDKVTETELEKFKTTLQTTKKQFQQKKEKENKIYDKNSVRVLGDIDIGAYGVTVNPDAQRTKKKVQPPPSPPRRVQPQDDDDFYDESAAEAMMDVDNEFQHDVVVKKPKVEQRFRPDTTDVWSSQQEDADGAFAQRANPGKVEVTFAPVVKVEKDQDYELWDDAESTVSIVVDANSQKEPYRYMNDEIIAKSDVLEEKLVTMGESIVAKHNLPKPGIFHIPSQDFVVALGRVCGDHTGEFNLSTAYLESTDEFQKARVKLDLSALESHSLFRGEVVIAEGVNNTGKVLNVTRLYEPEALPTNKAPADGANKPPYAPLNIVIATGPYTTSDTLAYRPLEHLLEYVEKNNPQVVILVGPFLDSTQPLVQTQQVPYNELFKAKITTPIFHTITEIARQSLPPTRFVIVPSTKDVVHDVVLPQAPFDTEATELRSKWIHLVPNPCTLRINDITFGLSSTDVLKNLSGEEISKAPTGTSTDRIGRLCHHVIKQQSYYPIFPPSIGVSIDYGMEENLSMPYTPDVVLFNSDLQHFVKNVAGVLCVNPGHISKGKSGGTYAKVTVYPTPKKQEEMDDADWMDDDKLAADKAEASIVSRTKVEIVRI